MPVVVLFLGLDERAVFSEVGAVWRLVLRMAALSASLLASVAPVLQFESAVPLVLAVLLEVEVALVLAVVLQLEVALVLGVAVLVQEQELLLEVQGRGSRLALQKT
jgi:hypothetical protein